MNENLAAWMKNRNMSNSQLAEKMGVSRYLVWRFVSGEREITASFKWHFAEKFGFDEARTVFVDMPDALPEQVRA